MSIEFLSPLGGLLALGAAVPLSALVRSSARAGQVRRALGLAAAPRRLRVVPAAAIAAAGCLVGLAAAQPVLGRTVEHSVRADAEAYVVLDVSRSMLAARGPGEPTRLERAKAAARELRAALPGVPVGVASLTDRVLPHLFPSPDEAVFRATLDRSLAIERPPPQSAIATNATTLDALTALPTRGFFSPQARRRLAVLLTDGESRPFSVERVGRRFRSPAPIGLVVLHLHDRDERVFTRGVPEPEYRPDSSAPGIVSAIASAAAGSAHDEDELGDAIASARAALGAGETVVVGDRRALHALAPYAALAAFLPLALLLARRDR